MAMMKSPFDQVVPSLYGHRLVFKSNTAVHVPEKCVPECLKVGIRIFDGEPKVSGTIEDQLGAAPAEKSDNGDDAEAEFKVGLDGALMAILTRNDPTDLKGDLTPKLIKVVAEMSPDLRSPTATEVSNAYQALQENIDLAE